MKILLVIFFTFFCSLYSCGQQSHQRDYAFLNDFLSDMCSFGLQSIVNRLDPDTQFLFLVSFGELENHKLSNKNYKLENIIKKGNTTYFNIVNNGKVIKKLQLLEIPNKQYKIAISQEQLIQILSTEKFIFKSVLQRLTQQNISLPINYEKDKSYKIYKIYSKSCLFLDDKDILYMYGDFYSVDDINKAIKFYKESYRFGNNKAIIGLGGLPLFGKKLDNLMSYFEKEAENGNAESMGQLSSFLLLKYRQNKKNTIYINKCIYWAERAAKLFDETGIITLYTLYDAGIGVDRNEKEAERLLKLLKKDK